MDFSRNSFNMSFQNIPYNCWLDDFKMDPFFRLRRSRTWQIADIGHPLKTVHVKVGLLQNITERIGVIISLSLGWAIQHAVAMTLSGYDQGPGINDFKKEWGHGPKNVFLVLSSCWLSHRPIPRLVPGTWQWATHVMKEADATKSGPSDYKPYRSEYVQNSLKLKLLCSYVHWIRKPYVHT